MRLSVDPEDKGYNLELAFKATVYFNGKRHNGAVTADEETGEIVTYIPRDDPRWKTEFVTADYWPTETLKGKVEIRIDSDGTQTDRT